MGTGVIIQMPMSSIIIVVIIFSTSVVAIQADCLPRCSCNELLTAADCTGLRLTKIPSTYPTSLSQIDFSNNRITNIQNENWQNYTTVTVLYLSSNSIEHLKVNAFRNLIRLNYLYLSNNMISHVPSALFSSNPSLEKVYFNHNPLLLPTTGSFLTSTSLKYLDISYCNLKELPSGSFKTLPKLEAVRLDGNPILFNDFSVFDPLKNLEEVYIENVTIPCSEAEGYFKVREIYLFGTKSCLSRNIVTISYSCTIQISFADCRLSGLKKIPLNDNNNLLHIDLSSNSIWNIGYSDLQSYSSVLVLDLAWNKISEIQADSFSSMTNVEYLYLWYNNISYISPAAFQFNNKLKEIYLKGNPLKIPNQGPFLESESLLRLDISFCNLIKLFEETFVSLPKLSVLNLNGNSLVSVNESTFYPLHNLKVVYMKFQVGRCIESPFNEILQYFAARNITYVGSLPCNSSNTVAPTTKPNSEFSFSSQPFSKTDDPPTEANSPYINNTMISSSSIESTAEGSSAGYLYVDGITTTSDSTGSTTVTNMSQSHMNTTEPCAIRIIIDHRNYSSELASNISLIILLSIFVHI